MGERSVNLNVISLRRYSEAVCRKLEKAVCVAACCRAVSMDGAAGFSCSGNGACGRVWTRLGKGEQGLHGWGSQSWELVEEKFLLYAEWVILHITAVDFEVGYVCLQWILQSCVGDGTLGICVRLGLISPLRAPMGSVLGSSRHHTGTACWLSLLLDVSLEQTAPWSPLMFLKHSCCWEYNVEMLELSITRSLTWESLWT